MGGIVAATLLVAVSAAWFKGPEILAWYCVRGLTRAGDGAEQDVWKHRTLRLGRGRVHGRAGEHPCRDNVIDGSVDQSVGEQRGIQEGDQQRRLVHRVAGASHERALRAASSELRVQQRADNRGISPDRNRGVSRRQRRGGLQRGDLHRVVDGEKRKIVRRS